MDIKGLSIYGIEIKYILFTFIIVFSDILGNGNLNLLYFAGVVFAVIMSKRIEYWKDIGMLFIPFMFLPMLFFLIHGGEMQPIRVIVYCIKIFLNISLFSYFKHNFAKIDLYREINRISVFFTVILLAAIILLNEESIGLWRYNDVYNTVSKTRLQFFYSEPSVLGFLVCIILVFPIYYFINNELNTSNIRIIGVFATVLILTFSISAIGYTALTTGFMILCMCINKSRIKKRIAMYIPLFVFAALVVLLTKNPISNRLTAIVTGNDASVFFRATLSSESLKTILYETHNWGLGLSNMNTKMGLTVLESTNMPSVYANSFMYLIAENGFMGVLYICWLVFIGLLACFRNRKKDLPIRSALMLIWFISQVAGGYFTDPTLWILFGIICSDCEIDKVYDVGKEKAGAVKYVGQC